jgi:hypothetical protein
VRITLPPKPGSPLPPLGKKETIRISLPQQTGIKKETVRIGEAKKETIRINLPTSVGQKRETIRIDMPESGSEDSRTTMRINVPNSDETRSTMRINLPDARKASTHLVPPRHPSGPVPPPPAGIKLPPPPLGSLSVPPPPAGAKLPPPPKPPGVAGLQPPPLQHAGLPTPPKPPGAPIVPAAPAAPAAPIKPSLPVPPAASKVATGPVAQKPVSPKKETTRITLAPDPKSIPKATVKLNQTVPLSAPLPSPSIKTANINPADDQQEEDPIMFYLSIAAAVVSLFAVVTAFLG